MSLIIIPDTHGCLDQLERLVDFLESEGYLSGHRLAFLGDYVDRGPKIRELLRYCIDLERAGHVFLCGNHEYVLERALSGSALWGERWLQCYEERTMQSFGLPKFYNTRFVEAVDDLLCEMTTPELEFIRTRPYYFENDRFVLVHGGLLSEPSWEDQRSVLDGWDRSQDEMPPQLRNRYLFLPDGLSKCVVSGHQIRPEPVIKPRRVALDLGVYEYKRLPAWIPDRGLLAIVNSREQSIQIRTTTIPP